MGDGDPVIKNETLSIPGTFLRWNFFQIIKNATLEMENFFESPVHQEIIHRLTGALAGYAETHQDAHFEKPNIAEAMQAVLKAK